MSSPPESKQTPLPTRAIRGLVAPLQLDETRRPLRGGGPADGGDHRIAFVQSRAGGDRDFAAALGRDFAHRRLELGGAEVAGGHVDQLADQVDGLGEARHLLDPRRLRSEQHPRPGLALGLLVALEPILGEQPAERRRAGRPALKPVFALRQGLGRPGEAPGT